MRVLVTGMIAGMNDAAYLQKVVAIGHKNGRDIKIFDAVDHFTKQGKKALERLLGTTDYVFELTREREYERIGYEIEKHKYDDVLIRVPATVEWNRINRKFKDQRYIRDFIRPDLIVTLIDAEWLIKEKLENPSKADPFLNALRERNHNLYEILSWMNEEVSLSEDWAKYMNIPHYVMAVGEPAESLYKLATVPNPLGRLRQLFHDLRNSGKARRSQSGHPPPSRLRGYHRSPDGGNRHELRSRNPGQPRGDLRLHGPSRLALVCRQSRRRGRYSPYPERPPLSAGMMDELGHARDYMKSRYMIFPKGFSPFTTDSYIEKGHLFEEPDAFFAHLDDVEKRPKFTEKFDLQKRFETLSGASEFHITPTPQLFRMVLLSLRA